VTGFVGLLYFGILVVMWLQRNEMTGQRGQMILQRTGLRESSERQLRAYISVERASLTALLDTSPNTI
jgi:hypothetical protein